MYSFLCICMRFCDHIFLRTCLVLVSFSIVGMIELFSHLYERKCVNSTTIAACKDISIKTRKCIIKHNINITLKNNIFVRSSII